MPTILVVDDIEDNRFLIQKMLEVQGHKVVLATNGEEAVQRVEEIRPALVLMDLSLPIIDGWQATRTLKATPHLAQIPIIALTAHAMAGDREQALEAGCDDYLPKPIDLHGLLLMVQTYLAKSVA